MHMAITGHRPESLNDPTWVKAALRDGLMQTGATLVIQGMASGVDLWSAVVAWHLDIPYIAVKPWAGHSPRQADEYIYEWVERHAKNVVEVSPQQKYPGAWAYHARNEYMVDNADALLAVWNGKKSGGTAACVNYAHKIGKPVFQINPLNQTIVGWEVEN